MEFYCEDKISHVESEPLSLILTLLSHDVMSEVKIVYFPMINNAISQVYTNQHSTLPLCIYCIQLEMLRLSYAHFNNQYSICVLKKNEFYLFSYLFVLWQIEILVPIKHTEFNLKKTFNLINMNFLYMWTIYLNSRDQYHEWKFKYLLFGLRGFWNISLWQPTCKDRSLIVWEA